MTSIQHLRVDGFRNLQAVDLHPSPRFNLVLGPNGSGKTSLLEAVHVLGLGRSFRTQKIDPLVSMDCSEFLVFAELANETTIGLRRGRQGKAALRLQGQNQRNWQDVATALPLQLINSDSLSLLEGGARPRRGFMDWAVFHVEHGYLSTWRSYKRCLAHRNSLLRAGRGRAGGAGRGFGPGEVAEMEPWEQEIARLGGIINSRRQALLGSYLPVLQDVLASLMPHWDVELEYRAGWDEEQDLLTLLQADRGRDLRYGATQYGPHRADFLLRCNARPAVEVLSRGQLKMLVITVKLAMGRLIESPAALPECHPGSSDSGQVGQRCTYLIDDLAAELDQDNRGRVAALLEDCGAQCFFTAIEEEDLLPVMEKSGDGMGKFHVEHGKIQAIQ